MIEAAHAELVFNVIYLGIAVLISIIIMSVYKTFPPRNHGLVLWALFLILSAALLFGLYSKSLDAWLQIKGLRVENAAVRQHMVENLQLLVFVVPATFLGIAVNLLTNYINIPWKRNRELRK